MESKNKPPAFQFYAGDFLSDLRVSLMSMEERGVYITLLAYAWLEDGLPNKPKLLKGLCGNPKNWDSIWGNVSECFTVIEGDSINNRRLVKERDKLLSYKKLMSTAGKKGAKSRWGSNGKAIAKPKPSHSSSIEVEVEDEDEVIKQFFEFWELYPKKQAKKTALKSYMKVFKENKKLSHKELISAVKKQMNSKQWKKDGGEFIPMPATWINQERWKDSDESYNEYKDRDNYRQAKSGLYIAYCSVTGSELYFNSLQEMSKCNFTSPAGGELLTTNTIPD